MNSTVCPTSCSDIKVIANLETSLACPKALYPLEAEKATSEMTACLFVCLKGTDKQSGKRKMLKGKIVMILKK